MRPESATMEVARRDDNRPSGAGSGEQRSHHPFGDSALERRWRKQPAAEHAPTNGPPEHGFLQRDRRRDRQQQRKLPPLAIDLCAELAARVTLTQVPAKVGASQCRAPPGRDLRANIDACRLARGLAGQQ
jgi:hypothetical protein